MPAQDDVKNRTDGQTHRLQFKLRVSEAELNIFAVKQDNNYQTHDALAQFGLKDMHFTGPFRCWERENA